MNKNQRNEIFEINDFTNSTEFEEFIYSVEQTLEVWGLSQGRCWNESGIPEFNRTENVIYNSQSFKLTHSTISRKTNAHPLLQLDFPNKTHCLNRWYGLNEFLILSPETTEDAVYFLDSSKLLLSSLACALSRTRCKIPILIQLGSVSKRFFSGVWFNDCVQTNFEMVLLKAPPPQCSTLKEIMNFYRKSIPCALSPFPVTNLSIRYTFCLNNFIGSLSDSHVYEQNPEGTCSLPFGAACDPIQDLLLATSWVKLSEHLIDDSETGELDPMRAPNWSLRCTFASNPYCVLYSHLEYCISMMGKETTIIQILGTSADHDIEVDVSGAFRNLTKTPPLPNLPSFGISSLSGKWMGKYGNGLTDQLLDMHMSYVFGGEVTAEHDELQTNASPVKSSPADSITRKLSVSLCLVLCSPGGMLAFAQLWRAVVEKLRSFYESGKLIPGISANPDTSYSLLHQKLQMLNACISQKIERESAKYTSVEVEDQFKKQEEHDTLQILMTGEPLRIPLTQRHPPVTEDIQEEMVEALTKLGSSAEASRLRAEMHSVALMSDMQAFKAANPTGRLEDFIRWYSPRDWIPLSPGVSPEVPPMSQDKPCVSDGAPPQDNEPEMKNINEEIGTDFDRDDTEKICQDDSLLEKGVIVENDEPEIEEKTKTDEGDQDEPVKEFEMQEMKRQERFSEDEESVHDMAETDRDLTSDGLPEGTNNDSEQNPLPQVRDQGHDSQMSDDDDDDFQDAADDFLSEDFKSITDVSEMKEDTSSHVTSTPNILEFEEPLDPHLYGGTLSKRMANNNVWKEVWYHAKPLPVWNQKRLFDDTKEAERVFHEFGQSSVGKIVGLVLPSLVHAAYDRILECPDSRCEEVQKDIKAVHEQLRTIRSPQFDDQTFFTDIADGVYSVEIYLSMFNSLRRKLLTKENTSRATHPNDSTPIKKSRMELEKRTRRMDRAPKLSSEPTTNVPQSNYVHDETKALHDLTKTEVELPGGCRNVWGPTLQRLFHAQQVHKAPGQSRVPVFPAPVGREYILQTTTRHPSPSSRDCPQRMYVTISGSEFRMAYANTSDKCFS